jgi:CubicO group peptidase (beta-lactamase class C family)
MYNTGSQVLGVLIERAAGKLLETFLRERMFEPLGMVDTAFSFSAAQRDRVTTAYAPDPQSGGLHVLDDVEGSYWSGPTPFPHAGGWLVSTIDDFWAFVQMLLGDGTYNGERILREASVEVMTTDHVTREQRESAVQFLGGGGWGYGMAVPAATGARPCRAGSAGTAAPERRGGPTGPATSRASCSPSGR